MKHDGEPGDALFNLLEDVEAQGGWYQYTLFVDRALLGGELVGPVRGTDRDRQRVDAGACYEVYHLIRFCVGVALGYHIVLDAGQDTQFALYRYVELMRVLDHLLGQRDILFVR